MVPTPQPAHTTGDEGARQVHHVEEGKEADSFWGPTTLGVVRCSGSLKYVASNGGVRLAAKTEEGSAQRSPGVEKKLRTAMLGTAGAHGVDAFRQLGSSSSRRPAHGGDGDRFGEQCARLGRPAVGNRGGECGNYGEARWHGTMSSHPR
jgi:hypothetical protein